MRDLETRGFLPNLDALEIGSLRHFEIQAVTTLNPTLSNLTRTISCLLRTQTASPTSLKPGTQIPLLF